MGFFSDMFSTITSFFTAVFRSFKKAISSRINYSYDFYPSKTRSFGDRTTRKYYSYDKKTYPNECRNKTQCKSSIHSVVASEEESFELLEMASLEEFPMPKSIFDIESNESHSEKSNEIIDGWISQKTKYRLSEDLYIGAYKTMAFFEEAAEKIEIQQYNLTAVELHQYVGEERIEIYFNVTPGSDELCVAIDDKKLKYFILKSKISETTFNGKINRRVNDKIFVEIFKKNFEGLEIYDILFQVNRMNLQLQHNALKFIGQHQLFPILINNPLYQSQSSQLLRYSSYNHFQSITNQKELNVEQMKAVECIVSGTYNPVPYLLYGPPGTGKTKTVVASIERIVRTTNKNILVCAQSNAACNEITERLTKVLTRTEMLRMFSKSYDLNEISPTIKPFCNLLNDKLQYPSLEYLYKFRVLICTLATSGCLVRANISDDFNPCHFGYIFIDECASAHETMSLVPIAGLCTSVGKVNSNIVLIGDPKQLDAVTKSTWSTKLGFKTSWFEQLFNSEMYKRNTVTGKFNQTYITQLVRNYRSHRAILKVPNELFYENALEAVVTPDLVRLEVEGLTSAFPIIFKSVHGYCKRDDKSPSSYNMQEVNEVLDLTEELLEPNKYGLAPSDIGIVSPYKLQCNIIRRHCEKKAFKEITVGSAETFQGQERKIMIISTVRSGGNLGDFLKNPQRFNVMLTRAKSLLIVVGNPHLLSQDENWSTFIRYCYKNRCLVQDKKYFRPRKM